MTYTKMKKQQKYFTQRSRRYPNEADPSYFIGRLLDGVTAVVTGMGALTLLMYFLTF